MKRKLMFMIPIGIGAIVLVSFVGGTVVKLLWNWLLPSLFGVPAVTFWQALGLLALCRILFGNIGGGGRKSGSRLTPEERERFRAKLRLRMGSDATGSRPSTS